MDTLEKVKQIEIDYDLYFKFLGYWNPIKSKYWFIWLEEWWTCDLEDLEFRYCILRKLFKTKKSKWKNWFFTLDIFDYHELLWESDIKKWIKFEIKAKWISVWYEIFKIISLYETGLEKFFNKSKEFEDYKNIWDIFIWEISPLPVVDYNNDTFLDLYWINKEYFFNNSTLIENRLNYLFSLLNDVKSEVKKVFIYSKNKRTLNLIKKIFNKNVSKEIIKFKYWNKEIYSILFFRKEFSELNINWIIESDNCKNTFTN